MPSSEASRLTHPDILPHILEHADEVTLSRCMQVSWDFFKLSSPLLYSSITIVPNEADLVFKGASTGPMIFSDGSVKEMKRDLLRQVKVLSIKKHEDCSGFTGTSACTRWRGIGIEFPQLKILRIYDDPLNPYMGGWFGCPWIPYLTPSPDKLVMRDVNYISATGPYSFAPSKLTKQVKKIVITIRNLLDLRRVNENFSSLFTPIRDQPISPDTETVLIFWTDNPTQNWTSKGVALSLTEIDNIIEQISICAMAKAKRLIVCNLDKISILDKTPEEVGKFMQSGIQEMVRGISDVKGERKKVSQRLKIIEYMSFQNYLGKEDRQGEFDKQEIESWLR